MYADDLKEVGLDFDNIYLDPNNPRFWSEASSRDVSDRKIVDSKVQDQSLARMAKYGISELKDSILRNGFLPLDRIVVRPIEGDEGNYVVVEGNRRVSALKLLRQQIDDDLIDEDGIDDDYLQQLKESTNNLEVLVYSGSETHDIAWLLQGVRHIGGIREWQPAQRAKLIADQIESLGMGFKQAGQQFGLSAQAVGRLYRSYKALEQMRNDDEFQDLAKNEYFSLFEEAVRRPSMKEWLGWSEPEKCFKNTENLHTFYAWISPDPEDADQRRRIHDPKQIKLVSELVASKDKKILTKIDDHELSVGAAYERLNNMPSDFDWEDAISKASELLSSIPMEAVKDNPMKYIKKVNELMKNLELSLKMAEVAKE